MIAKHIILIVCLLLAHFASGQTIAASEPSQATAVRIEMPQDAFRGSVVVSKPTGGVLSLSLRDAIERGLRYNLGLYVADRSTREVQAQRLRALAGTLPNVTANLQEQVQRVNLEAAGLGRIRFPVPGFRVPRGIGPFSTSGAAAELSWDLLDLHAMDELRAEKQSVRAAELSYQAARETVVVAVSANYLSAVAAQARVDAAQAQVNTARSMLQLAQDREKAGLAPEIDSLRATVELQSRQQALTDARNALAKQKIALARMIGLPVPQQIELTDQPPFRPLPESDLNGVLQQALANRPEYRAAAARLRAAELQHKAALQQRLPSLGFNAEYGVLGPTPSSMTPQWTVLATLKVPVFLGGKIAADAKQSEAVVDQNRARIQDLRGQIEQDVENAVLDLRSAAEQVDTAVAQLKLAKQTVAEAEDRYRAGVTNNIEVIQAQEALALASDSYINGVYAYNTAKVLLAHAVGNAEQGIIRYLEAPGRGSAPLNSHP
jgi:outer membrane protein TolC